MAKPGKDINVETIKVGNVPALVLKSKEKEAASVAVLWIHGGGYFYGTKEAVYQSRAMSLIRKHGVTVYAPGYRLSWQKPYPAAVNDCFAVLQYMDEHKKELGFDRIMVGGESAGGGLTAAVCMMARDKGIHVAYQMPLYPMLSNFDTESSKNNHGKIWNTRRNHFGWWLYLRGHAHDNVSPYASPSRQTDYSNLAPCYTFVGDGEPFYSETLKYVEDLKAAGVEAAVDVYHTDFHGFDLFKPKEETSKTAIEKFMEHFDYAMANYR